VKVNPIPDVIVNSPSICKGESATLTASGADIYTWSTGATDDSIVVSPVADTSYSVTGTSLGCTAAADAYVEVNDLPLIELGPDIDLQEGQDTVLNANGTDVSYLWSTGEVTSSILVNAPGTYVVTVTNSAGCTATDSVIVTVITATIEPGSSIRISFSPNPSDDFINILCKGSATSMVRLIDQAGTILMTDYTLVGDGFMRKLNLTAWPAGMYYVSITGAGFTQTFPIWKK
jgi:hypothetical protein